jgi:hypothetical protein
MRSRLGTAYEAGVGGCIYQGFTKWVVAFLHGIHWLEIYTSISAFQSMMDGRQRRTGRRADPVPQKFTNDSKFILFTPAF